MVEAALDTWAPHLGDDPLALEAIERRLWNVLRGNGAAHAALEMALHDWIGKRLTRRFRIEGDQLTLSFGADALVWRRV